MPRLLIALLCLSLAFTSARAGDVTVRWTPPDGNVDGSLPPDLGGYVISYSTDPAIPASNVKTVTLSLPQATSYTATGLTAGTWYFTMRSVAGSDARVLSQRTNIVSTTVAADPVCPAAPAPESRLQSCAAPLVGNWTQRNAWAPAPEPQCWVPAWLPTDAPAGICATPPSLTTASTSAYQYKSATLPMALVGLVPAGIACGPETKLVNGVKYCRVLKVQVDLVVWPSDLSLTEFWARTQ